MRTTSHFAMSEIFSSFLLVYAGLFPIVNPVGNAPIFLTFAERWAPDERHGLALQVAMNGCFLLLGALFVGSYVLEFFGITLPVLRVAGGLLIAAFAWNLLNSRASGVERGASGDGERIDAFYPLTMPLTVGPGSISVAITLGSQRPKPPDDLANLALLGTGAVAGVLALSVTVYLCYRFAERIVAAFGASGTNVLVRLSAFILLCIGLQIVWDGFSTLIHNP